MFGEETSEEMAYWAAREERTRLVVALVRGEVQILGKPVRLVWPEGEPLHLDKLVERIGSRND
jgi:hypothetical protein